MTLAVYVYDRIASFNLHTQWKAACDFMGHERDQVKRIMDETQKIYERYKWDATHLVKAAIDRTYSYCVRDIYFSCKEGVTTTLSESEIRSLITQHTENDIKEIFAEVFQWIDGMYAADVLNLYSSSSSHFMKNTLENFKKEVEGIAPVDVERPAPSVDDKTTALALYKILANRDSGSCAYELEGYHRGADEALRKRGIHSELPPVSELVHKVVTEKIREFLHEVALPPKTEAS